MANLVPLHIDKETGAIVATGVPGAGGGGGGGELSPGFLYVRTVASTTWNILHNSASEQLICQVYDITGEFILPNSITIIDGNNVQITFAAPQAGKAHLLFFELA